VRGGNAASSPGAASLAALAVRTRQRYEQVRALPDQGKGIKPIMRQTGLAKETVRHFYRAATIDELLVKVRDGRPSLLDDHKPYLHHRWDQGCTNVRQLHAELKQRGYKGSYGTIRDYMLPFREAGAAPPAVPARPRPATSPAGSSPTGPTSTTGSPPSRPTTSPTCTPAPEASDTTTRPSSTG
jgi:hypothetical protein